MCTKWARAWIWRYEVLKEKIIEKIVTCELQSFWHSKALGDFCSFPLIVTISKLERWIHYIFFLNSQLSVFFVLSTKMYFLRYQILHFSYNYCHFIYLFFLLTFILMKRNSYPGCQNGRSAMPISLISIQNWAILVWCLLVSPFVLFADENQQCFSVMSSFLSLFFILLVCFCSYAVAYFTTFISPLS